MTNKRTSHVSKTRTERGIYLDSLNALEPTVTKPDTQSSNTTTIHEKQQELPQASKKRPISTSTKWFKWAKEHLTEVLISILIMFLAFLGYSSYTLNGTVGEIKGTLKDWDGVKTKFENTRDIVLQMNVKVEQLWTEFINKGNKR